MKAAPHRVGRQPRQADSMAIGQHVTTDAARRYQMNPTGWFLTTPRAKHTASTP